MKISEVTQKSHSEQLAEDRKQLDEIAPAVWAGLGIAGAGMTGYETYKNYKAFKRGDISQEELIARVGGDVALGLIGGGALGIGKALAKGAWRGGKKLMGFGDNTADVATATRDAEKAAGIKTRAGDLNYGNKNVKRKLQTFKIKRKASARDRQARADLKKAKDDAKIIPKIKKKDLAKGTVLGLAVPDSLDPLRDPTYKALGGANRDGQPDAGSGMDGKSKPGQKFEPEKKTGYRFGKLPD